MIVIRAVIPILRMHIPNYYYNTLHILLHSRIQSLLRNYIQVYSIILPTVLLFLYIPVAACIALENHLNKTVCRKHVTCTSSEEVCGHRKLWLIKSGMHHWQ